MGAGDILLGGDPAMDCYPVQEGVAILLVASYYENRDKLQPCGPPWPECDFIPFLSSRGEAWVTSPPTPLFFKYIRP